MSKVKLPANLKTFLKRWYSGKLSDDATEVYQSVLYDLERESKWVILCNDYEDSGFKIKREDDEFDEYTMDLLHVSETPYINLPTTTNIPVYALIIGTERYYDNMVLNKCIVTNEGGIFPELNDIEVSYTQNFSFMSILEIVNKEYKEIIKTY